MKSALLICLMLLTQVAFSQTMKEEKLRQEMTDRTDLLISKVEAAREDLKVKDVINACKKIHEIFAVYPEQLKSIGTHMDLNRSKTIKAKDAALNELIAIHRKSIVCQQGKDSEYVDPEVFRDDLKASLKILKKQKELIKTLDLSYEIGFYYNYRL